MKKYFVVIFFCMFNCKSSEKISFNKISDRIFKVQKNEKRFAPSAYVGRKLFLNKNQKLYFNSSDTLFLIERIGEPSLEVWSNIWTSKRDLVYEYERDSEILKDTVLNYKSWQNRYKFNVERFDTTTVDKHVIMGGYRTFITQVIGGKEVKTFFFSDSYSGFNINR